MQSRLAVVGRAIAVAHRHRQLTAGARRLEIAVTVKPREDYSAWVRRDKESSADLHKRAAGPIPAPQGGWFPNTHTLKRVYDSVNRLLETFQLETEDAELLVSPWTWRTLKLPVDVRFLFGMRVDTAPGIEDDHAVIYDGALYYRDPSSGTEPSSL